MSFFSRLAGLLLLSGSTLVAIPVGANITIFDGKANSQVGATWGYGAHEDNETENSPNTVLAQKWDLEGMYMNGTQLSLVGGYNFKIGQLAGGYTYKTGDIFVATEGIPLFGSANTGQFTTPGPAGYSPGSSPSYTNLNTYGFNYVIHFNSVGTPGVAGYNGVASYDVYKIDASTVVTRSEDVATSNPWTWSSGGIKLLDDVPILGFRTLGFSEYSTLTTQGSAGIGLLGDANTVGATDVHYALTVDTSFLPGGADAYFHYTMECGNDNLMGRTATVPDSGSTFLFLSSAIAVLFGLQRRKTR